MGRELDPAIARVAAVAVATTLLPLAGPLGCSYGWEIGAPAPDGAAGAPAAGGAGGGGGSGGASGAGGADCAALAAHLDEARKAAKACTIAAPDQCDASVKDECGCDSHVKDPASPDTAELVAAVDALMSAGCAPSCSSCLLGPGTCLYSDGMGPYCVP